MSNCMRSNEPLGRRLVFTAKAMREAFEDALHEAGSSLGTWVVLSAVSDEGIISQSALASHVHLEGATLTLLVDRVVELGLVRRQLDPKDRRVRKIELTPEGERLHRDLLVAMRKFERALLAGLSERQLTELRNTLTRIGDNLAAR
jgi:MarR family transcriptional regulator for hemolysin